MSGNWAYSITGRLRHLDEWDWLRPEGYVVKGNPLSWPALIRSQLVTNPFQQINLEAGRHIIGFDGKNWFSGHASLPSVFLDPGKYNSDQLAHFSHDGPDAGAGSPNGRQVDYTHGYISETNAFPEHIPQFTKQSMSEMHEKHVIPIFDTPPVYKDKAISTKTLAPYEAPSAVVSLSDHLPPEAIEKLRQAWTESKPILIHYDPVSKQYTQVQSFERDLARTIAENTKPLPAPATTHIPTTGIINNAEHASPAAENWVARIWNHPAGKVGVIGGGLVLAGAGIWALRAKQEDKSKQQDTAVGK